MRILRTDCACVIEPLPVGKNREPVVIGGRRMVEKSICFSRIRRLQNALRQTCLPKHRGQELPCILDDERIFLPLSCSVAARSCRNKVVSSTLFDTALCFFPERRSPSLRGEGGVLSGDEATLRRSARRRIDKKHSGLHRPCGGANRPATRMLRNGAFGPAPTVARCRYVKGRARMHDIRTGLEPKGCDVSKRRLQWK